MKFKSTLIAVAATMLICSQSYAGDLLDRMLGMGGCGCQSSCCDAPVAGPGCGSDMIAAPSCGCDTGCDPCARPKLIDFRFKVNWCSLPRPCFGGCSTGCDTGCDTGCAAPAAPACGCDTVAAPACGCAPPAAPACGCDTVAPAADCGCATTCDPCSRPCLLDRLHMLRARIAARPRLFGGCCDMGCCDSGCDTGCGVATPACGTDAPCGCGSATPAPAPAPAPAADAPAPMVDPNA